MKSRAIKNLTLGHLQGKTLPDVSCLCCAFSQVLFVDFLILNYFLTGEILPSDMRSLGAGLLGVLDNLFLFLAVKLIPLLIRRC